MTKQHDPMATLQAQYTQLQQRETLYHSLYTAMMEGVVLHELITDAAGTPVDYRVLDVNPSFERITGLSRDNVVGQLASVAYGTGAPPYLEQYAYVVRDETSITFETTFEPMQKTFRITAFATVPGQFAAVFADITDKKRAKVALRESEARYRAVSEMTSDYAYAMQVTAEGAFLLEWVTDAFARITGYDPGLLEASDQIIISIIHPDDLPAMLHRRERLLAGQEDISELRIVRRTGDVCWLRDYARPVWDAEAGRVVCIYGAAQDITARKQAEHALEESETRYRVVSEMTSDFAFALRIGPDGVPVPEWITDAFTRITGLSSEDAHDPEKMSQIIHPDDRERLEAHQAQVLTGNDPGIIEFRILRDGEVRWLRHYFKPVWDDENNRLERVYGAAQDVTERRLTEEALRESERRYREITALVSDGVYSLRLTPEGEMITEWGAETLGKITGYPSDTMDVQQWISLIHPEDSGVVQQRLDVLHTFQPVVSEYRIVTVNGEVRWIRDHGRPVRDATTGRLVRVYGAVQDVTDYKRYEQQIEHLAFSDPLTGLANRRRLYDVGEAALTAHPERTVLLYLDLDRFKAFNDSLGHDAGDALLVAVARRLRHCLNQAGLFARIGGDEFAVLLTDSDSESAVALATTLLAQLQEPFDVQAVQIYLDGSIGIALGTAHPPRFSSLLTRADIAMYRAKRTRTAIAVYDPLSETTPTDQMYLEAELRHALATDGLTLHYQPIFDMRTGYLFAVEALVRWPHPRYGLLPPGRFLPLAAEVGLSQALDSWVLRAALNQVARWQATGKTLTVTVNLDAPLFWQADLVGHLSTLLHETGVPAERLILELTEHTALHDVALTSHILNDLRELGVRVALDDFGTGYAALTHLRELPVDIIKIERIFTAGIGQNRRDEAVLRAVLALGSGLDLLVITEGVEAEAQRTWLHTAGCHYVQGYLLGRPMPAADFE
jgi:diguanylate cyclase (GGDEF)-like protein/PAS domain S-box-containing protein